MNLLYPIPPTSLRHSLAAFFAPFRQGANRLGAIMYPYPFKVLGQRGFWLVVFLLLVSKPLLAQDWSQIIKTAASDRRTLSSLGRVRNDNFGSSVAIDGDYAVVGIIGDADDASGDNPLSNAGSALVFKRINGTWTQVKKLVAADRGAADYFGTSVAISGNTIVVGAFLEDEDANGANLLVNSGSAYVFSRDQGGADNWGQVKKLVAADRAATNFFGYSVGISGNAIVVGAYQQSQDASGGNPLSAAGAAYVFNQNQGGTNNWGQVRKLVAADRGESDYFGQSVAISGSTIVVGAYTEDEDATGGNRITNAGSAYIFSQDQGGTNNWGQVKKLVAADRGATDYFGYSVAISGNTAVVGAYFDDKDVMGGNPLTNSGSAYVFSRDQGGAGNWGQVKKLVATDRASADQFGYSVSISGGSIVVGAYTEDEDATGGNTLSNTGSAYIFSQNQGGGDNWGQVKKIVANDRAGGEQFGNSVAISSNTIVVGASADDKDETGTNLVTDAGSAYLFTQNQGGTDNWGQAQKVVLNDYLGNSYYGYSVAIDGDYAVVGANQDYTDANSSQPLPNAGSAYVLKRQNGIWTQIKKLVAADRAANDNFGSSVAISGSLIVVGAYQESEDGTGGNTLINSGSAYVFSQSQGGADNWGQVKKLVASDRAAGDKFGNSVGISGNIIVVGAYQESEDGTGGNTLINSGSAYVFSQNQGGADNWGQVKKLAAADRAANDYFGFSVAVSGSQIVVGAYLEDEDVTGGSTLTSAGSAYVFNQNQGGADNWGQVKKLVASDRAIGDYFGASVAISGDLIVVGAFGKFDILGNQLLATGSAYVFSRNQGGTDNWGQAKKLLASDRANNDYFGCSVAISGGQIVVGAFSEDQDALGNNTLTEAGSAYVFSQNQGGTGNWGQVQKLVASDRAIGDYFGFSVAVSGSQIVVGASREDEDAMGGNTLTNTGSAYVFELTGITLTGFSPSQATVCVGSVTSVTATIGNLTSSYNYTLTNGSSTTSGASSSSTFSQPLIARSSGTPSLTLIVNQNGNTYTATTSLTINAGPLASIVPSNPTLTCTTTSLNLTATGGDTYLWNTSSPNAILPVTSSGTYSVLVTGSNSCTASATTTVTSNTVLTLMAGSNLPQANVGVTVSLTASGATSYQWSAPSTVLLTSPATSSAVSASLTTAGVQAFTVVGTSGICSQSALVSVTALTGPDLSAIILLPSGGFSGGETKGLVMKLQEVNGSDATGSIVVTITVPSGYSVSFDNSLSSILVSGGGTESVQNEKWEVSRMDGSQQLSLRLKGGESIGARSSVSVGFWVSRTSANGGSRSNITVNVADDSSGSYDVNRFNNVYARIINGL